MIKREMTIGDCRLILGDCLEVLPTLGKVDAVVTDPPYPNAAGHFVEGIATARKIMAVAEAGHWMVFWTEVEKPPVSLPLVAVHVWHRTNTNRPDNYEPIFEFNSDGVKKASRVLPHCVIFPGLTGIEASGHPTEKNVNLMMDLVKRTRGAVLDPFMGSGTTGVACVKLGRKFIGIEIDEGYFAIACERIRKAYAQPDMFVAARVPEPTQEAFL